MPSAAAIYQQYSDEVAHLATITIETCVDPGDDNYGPAALVDDNPAKVAKINSVTGAWQFAYPAKKPVAIVGLIHADFDAGADVVIQGDDAADWVTPAFEAAITIPAWLGSGTGAWPVNPWLDLTEAAGYDAAGWQYYRLLVTANSQNLQLGQVWFGSEIRRLSPNLHWGFTERSQKRTIANETSYGVQTIYTRGTTEWRLEASGEFGATLQAALEAQWADVDGTAYPWLFVPDGLVNRCYLVRWAELIRAERHIFSQQIGQELVIRELARGLRPGV